MQALSRLSLVCLIICSIGCARAQHAARLKFELQDRYTGQPMGWHAGIGKGESGKGGDTATLDSLVKQEGRYSYSLSKHAGENFASLVYGISGTYQGHTIRLRGYMKTENVSGWAGLWMRVDGTSRAIAFDNMGRRPVTGTTDWTAYEIELPYDESEAKGVALGALIVGDAGKIWIDNFSVTLDGIDIDDAKLSTRELLPADRDTGYNGGSGIRDITLTSGNIRSLTNLGMLWGFIKYYHADVQKGSHNMDAALFRVLPRVLAAPDQDAANKVLESWVDSFGVPPPCGSCKTAASFSDVLLQPDYGDLFRKDNLPPSLVTKLEYIRDNRYHTIGTPLVTSMLSNRSKPDPESTEHYYISLVPGVANPIFRNEYDYSRLPYPDAGIRLLALYRYWNMIQYFFPYRHLIGEDWNRVLADAMPEFCSAADTTAYQVACLKLIARVNDCHAGLGGSATMLPFYKGVFITPFRAQFVEDKLVVTGFFKDTLDVRGKVQRGDVIESLDGVAIKDLVTRFLPFTPASNYATKLRNVVDLRGFLLRSHKPTVAVELTRDGKRISLELPRVLATTQLSDSNSRALFDPQVPYKILPGNIGYIYPARIKDANPDSAKALLHHTKALIIDFRCYPGSFMPFTYGQWLKAESSAFADFSRGSTDLPGMFVKTGPVENGGSSDAYKGKVIILVNEGTQSSAEYQTMAFQSIPGALTMGSTTAGADGNVSEITLPGGLGTMISGIAVLYPDGTETQRKGVKIDRVVHPGIKGIKEGRDEVLEAALRLINGK